MDDGAKLRDLAAGGARAHSDFFIHHLEEQMIAQISFWDLPIEFSLRFGNWDFESLG
jgi:hypothetical protein